MPRHWKCLHCGDMYFARSADQKFCGAACYRGYEKEHGFDSLHDRPEPIKFTCKTCGNPFVRLPGSVRAYVKKFGKEPQYCSTSCGGKGRRLSDEEWQVHCVQCGNRMPIQRKPGGTINRQRRLCSPECRSAYKLAEHARRRPEETREIQRSITAQGYVRLRFPNKGGIRGREVLEHRLVMEQRLGRELRPEETVHHLNGQRADNRPENIRLFSSRHGPGQAVEDKIAFAIEMLTLYPDFAAEAGYELVRKAPLHDDSGRRPEGVSDVLVGILQEFT